MSIHGTAAVFLRNGTVEEFAQCEVRFSRHGKRSRLSVFIPDGCERLGTDTFDLRDGTCANNTITGSIDDQAVVVRLASGQAEEISHMMKLRAPLLHIERLVGLQLLQEAGFMLPQPPSAPEVPGALEGKRKWLDVVVLPRRRQRQK